MRETNKLNELDFMVQWTENAITVTFKTPIVSRGLAVFLKKSGFFLSIDPKDGLTLGTWTSTMSPLAEYEKLKELFREYKTQLPVIAK